LLPCITIVVFIVMFSVRIPTVCVRVNPTGGAQTASKAAELADKRKLTVCAAGRAAFALFGRAESGRTRTSGLRYRDDPEPVRSLQNSTYHDREAMSSILLFLFSLLSIIVKE
jgi:hypothetical protein